MSAMERARQSSQKVRWRDTDLASRGIIKRADSRLKVSGKNVNLRIHSLKREAGLCLPFLLTIF
jgi:hypothetical protein